MSNLRERILCFSRRRQRQSQSSTCDTAGPQEEKALAFTPPFLQEYSSPSDDDLSSPISCVEDFNNEANSILSVDTIQGFRMTMNRTVPLGNRNKGELTASHTVNLGLYPAGKSQEDLLKALLLRGAGNGESGPRGTSSWSSFVRYVSPRADWMQVRHSSATNTSECRAMIQAGRWTSLQGSVVTSDISNFCRSLYGCLKNPREFPGRMSSEVELAAVVAEHATPHVNISSRAVYDGDMIMTSGRFSNRLSRKLIGGADINFVSPMNGIFCNFGLKYLRSPTSIFTSTLGVYPDFSRKRLEGLRSTTYSISSSALYRPIDRLLIAGSVSVPLHSPKSSVARVGYECRFIQSRVCGNLNSDLVLGASLENAAGLTLSGEIDFKKDNYRFGFGYEIAPGAATTANPSDAKSVNE